LPKFDDPDLLVGFETSDDAAVYRISDELAIIQTVDLFPPIVDDPYDFGRIAAANALSDVYAMGGYPKLAMNILCYPEDLPADTVQAILRGGYEKVMEAGAIIAGGHSIKDHEPKYGLSVTGFVHPEKILTNSGAKPGDLLILTKALGTGIINTAAKAGLVTSKTILAAIDSMAMLNKRAYEIMLGFPVHGCTDVTGFGLLGHAYEMAAGSGVTITLDAAAMPLLPEARDMARMGIIPAGAYANRQYLEHKLLAEPTLPLDLLDVLYDPQTSGGLLISLPEKDAMRLLAILKDELPCAELIGEVEARGRFSVSVR
jgi:selenide,water dikinase